MKVAWVAIITFFICFTAVGCRHTDQSEVDRIKVMYGGTERQFYKEYGDYFAAKFPRLDIEFLSWSEDGKGYENKIMTEKPDMVLLNSGTYAELAGKGLLLNLKPLIQRDQFDIGSIAPAVVDYLSSTAGDGKLYGLGTGFTSSVLIYNKDLLRQYGVAEPEGSIGWEQLYAMMRHFSVTDVSRERIYGFHQPFMIQPFSYVQAIADSSGLSLVNTSSHKITIDTEGWRKAFQLVADGIRNGSLGGGYRGADSKGNVEENDFRNTDLFGQGKAAMTIGNFFTVSQLAANPPAFQWDIAGAPALQTSASMSQAMDVSPIFAIYAKADHIETAWRVVKYLNSDEVARINSGLKTGKLPVRRQYASDLAGHDVEIFYRVASYGPSNARTMADYLTLPRAFRDVMGAIITEEFDAVLAGKTTVDEALKRMQAREQASLDAAIAA
ncbi:MAG: transporter substrate-binding protein, partial [Paenibacillus sp.]|nr:transporter substrate-binding protein [Paenibacillus sp.]